MRHLRVHIGIFITLAGMLFGCASRPSQNTPGGLSPEDIAFAIEKKITISTPDVKNGMKEFLNGKYLEASRSFSRALKYDPKNSGLHFLTALCYHMLVELGDTSQRELAEIGYNMAMEFDPSNPWPPRFMGHLQMSQKKYPEARDLFAKALQVEKDRPELLLALARAAYYAQDLTTARAAIAQAEKLDPKNPQVISAAAMIHAAAGDFDKSEKALVHFSTLPTAQPEKTKFINGRVQDWRSAHNTVRSVAAAAESQPPPVPAGARAPSQVPRMVTIDVVLIRSDEVTRTNKGVNLLNGLKLQFSGSDTRTKSITNVFDDSSAAVNTTSRALTSAISVPAVNYNLNIFNDNDAHHEVMARPTLISMDGKPSTFFAGATINVALEGGVGTTPTIQAVPIGVNLSVTPQFLDDDTVKLEVDAGREFVEEPNTNAFFTKFVQTSKNKVNVNVVMKFEETLIVSGMSEKESSVVRDGVPLLKDIPIIQYLFSNEKTMDYSRSILILMTPHRPSYLGKRAQGKGSESQDIQNLMKRVEWFAPASTTDYVLAHLASRAYYTEFRSGDIETSEWNDHDSIKSSIMRALGFLYF
jgi:Flp pilus assembly protein TadD